MRIFSTIAAPKFRAECFANPSSATQRATVLVSACLTGEKVRYDGADKMLEHSALLAQELLLLPICPEVGAGLGVPRAPVNLVRDKTGNYRALGRADASHDVTAPLQSFANSSVLQLNRDHTLCGYILKSRSPSCGLGSTPLYTADGVEIGITNGIQAQTFKSQLPHLAFCEETQLKTHAMLAYFILRCRLVFDFISNEEMSLFKLHNHYAFVRQKFTPVATEKLLAAHRVNDRNEYLIAFLEACDQIPVEIFLKLFQLQ